MYLILSLPLSFPPSPPSLSLSPSLPLSLSPSLPLSLSPSLPLSLSPSLSPPHSLSHFLSLYECFRLQGRLGQGQFGSVHKAVWKGATVAVKLLIEEATDISRIKFLQEAAIMGQFSHPNVIKLYGVVTDGDNIVSDHVTIM